MQDDRLVITWAQLVADLAYGVSAYSRERGNMPELPVINMIVEPSATAESGIVLQSRAGIEQESTVGAGPINGVFQRDGVFGGDRFVVSATRLYRDGVDLGIIDGTGPVQFAASEDELLVCRGAQLWSYNGTDLAVVDFPDDMPVHWVRYLAGYFVAGYGVTSQWNFSAPDDGRSWDGLDFANAENKADPIIDALDIDDVLILLGSESVEFWPKTGDATIPFAPTDGRVFEKGVIAVGAACSFDNSFAWVGDEGIVFVNAESRPLRVSDAGIEERIAKSATYRLFSYFFEGIEYLVLRIDNYSMIMSAATREWSEFQSYGRANWRCANVGPGPVFGDDTTNIIWRFGTGYTDADRVLERRFRGAIPLSGGGSINNIRLVVNVGETVNLTGTYADPRAEMRTSRDQARTFGNWKATALGRQGEYRRRVEWRALGMFDDPGMVCEFRVTDPVPFRVAAVKANEPGGGRSR